MCRVSTAGIGSLRPVPLALKGSRTCIRKATRHGKRPCHPLHPSHHGGWISRASVLRPEIQPRQIHDRGPDQRRQAVPVCDDLTECIVFPIPFRQALETLAASAIRNTGCVRQTTGAIPAARSAPIPAWLGRSAFGPLRQAGGRTQTIPFNQAYARRSHRPTHPGSNLAARCALHACHPRLVDGYGVGQPAIRGLPSVPAMAPDRGVQEEGSGEPGRAHAGGRAATCPERHVPSTHFSQNPARRSQGKIGKEVGRMGRCFQVLDTGRPIL